MARFDVFHMPEGGYVVDCQTDYLDHLDTRFVIPLAPRDKTPVIDRRLNPTFLIDDEPFVLQTQWAAAVSRYDLGKPVGSLAADGPAITAAIDRLTSGF